MIDSRLGIVNVLIDDKGGATRVLRISETDLSDRPELAKYIVHFLRCDLELHAAQQRRRMVRQQAGATGRARVRWSWQARTGRLRTYSARFTSGGRRCC